MRHFRLKLGHRNRHMHLHTRVRFRNRRLHLASLRHPFQHSFRFSLLECFIYAAHRSRLPVVSRSKDVIKLCPSSATLRCKGSPLSLIDAFEIRKGCVSSSNSTATPSTIAAVTCRICST